MDKIVNVKYISCWDGCADIETTAKVNVITGEIVDIEAVDVNNEYVICESEFVQYEDDSIEQVIRTDDNKSYIISKSEEQFHIIEIHDTKYTVSDDMDKDDVHRVYGVAY